MWSIGGVPRDIAFLLIVVLHFIIHMLPFIEIRDAQSILIFVFITDELFWRVNGGA